MSSRQATGWFSLIEMLHIERRVYAMRAGILGIIVTVLLVAWITGALPYSFVLSAIGLLAVCGLATLGAFHSTRRFRPSPAWWYVLNTLDATVTSGIILTTIATRSPSAALFSNVHLAYFLVIVGACARFHVPSAIYSVALCVAQHVAVVVVICMHPAFRLADLDLHAFSSAPILAVRPVLMVLVGVLAVSMIRRAASVFVSLQNADKEHAQLINRIGEGVLVCNPGHRIVEVNHAACELLGLPRSILVDMQAASVLPTPVVQFLQRYGKQIIEQGTATALGVSVLGGDGQKRHLDLTAHRVEEGDLWMIQILVRDATALHTLQQQAEQFDRLQALRALTTGASHEFNNLFATIEASSFMLSESIPKSAPEYTEVETIRVAATRASKFVREMLDLADMRPGTAEPIDVPSLLDGVLSPIASVPSQKRLA